MNKITVAGSENDVSSCAGNTQTTRFEWESGRLARGNNSAVSRETRKIGAKISRATRRKIARDFSNLRRGRSLAQHDDHQRPTSSRQEETKDRSRKALRAH